ncbi:hypothetical protein [Desulfovibrio inopinatus]|uniref:hypothetical protein n=1 Tax=Desulfovibrio inopinatus TaxID=102109 RepID=UPI000408202A|nr:hypothetical protein [Desulfovibrio inopinatus]
MRTWKAWFVVALVFFSGLGIGVVGSQYHFYLMHARMDAQMKAGVPPFFSRLADHLGLTQEQEEKAKAVFVQSRPQFQKALQQCKPAMDNVFEETVNKFKPDLNPSQQAELDRIIAVIHSIKELDPKELDRQVFGDPE